MLLTISTLYQPELLLNVRCFSGLRSAWEDLQNISHNKQEFRNYNVYTIPYHLLHTLRIRKFLTPDRHILHKIQCGFLHFMEDLPFAGPEVSHEMYARQSESRNLRTSLVLDYWDYHLQTEFMGPWLYNIQRFLERYHVSVFNDGEMNVELKHLYQRLRSGTSSPLNARKTSMNSVLARGLVIGELIHRISWNVSKQAVCNISAGTVTSVIVEYQGLQM